VDMDITAAVPTRNVIPTRRHSLFAQDARHRQAKVVLCLPLGSLVQSIPESLDTTAFVTAENSMSVSADGLTARHVLRRTRRSGLGLSIRFTCFAARCIYTLACKAR
jgi:hypothetical protein